MTGSITYRKPSTIRGEAQRRGGSNNVERVDHQRGVAEAGLDAVGVALVRIDGQRGHRPELVHWPGGEPVEP